MWKSKEKSKSHKIDTLVSHNTTVRGDIHFSGGLHIDGVVEGNVIADEGVATILTIGDQGRIEGEVHVPDVIINGSVLGDVFASQRLELAPNATVSGNVYYNLIKMMIGAKVNGNLIHHTERQECIGVDSKAGLLESQKYEKLEISDAT